MKASILFLVSCWLSMLACPAVVTAQCIRPVVISDAATVSPGGQTKLSAQPGDYWTKKNSLPLSNSVYAVAFSIGGAGYLTTGLVGGSANSGTWSYDTLTDTWTQQASFPGTPRSQAAVFVLQGKGYVVGGTTTSTILGDCWQYDPVSNAWMSKAPLPGGYVTVDAMAFVIGNLAFLAGGITNTTPYSGNVWAYDPSVDQWTSKAPLPSGLNSAAAFSLGGKGYIALGNANGQAQAAVYGYDPVLDVWSTKNNFPGPGRIYPGSFALGNRGFIFGGQGANGSLLNELWEYRPATDVWVERATLPGGGSLGAAAFAINRHAWVMGGMNPGGPANNVWEYTPALSYQWSNGATTTTVDVPAGSYTVTTTDVGDCSQTSQVVVVQSKTAPAVVPAVLPALCPGQQLTLYGDTANIWTQQATTPAAGRIGAVSFSIGSKGYTGTGNNGNGDLSDWWEYDDGTGVWTQKADVPGGGRAYSIGFALNGKGYVGMGNSTTGSGLNSDLWEYDPFTNSWTAKAGYPGGQNSAAVAFTAGSLAYVGLGWTWPNANNNNGYTTNFWSFDPVSDQWTPISSFPGTPRREATAFTITGKGYVTSGWANGQNNIGDCWQYDPATDTWTAQAPLPGVPRRTAGTFTIQDHAYVVGGFSNSNLAECWEFYNGVWTAKASYPGSAQWGMSGLGFHDHGLICFGSAVTSSVWCYHPNQTLQWPDGSTQQSFMISTPGAYSATIHDIEGCAIPTSPLTVTANSIVATIASSGATTFCAGRADTLSANGDVWTKKGTFPGGADWYPTGFSLGSAGYFCGGWSNLTQCWKYDAASDTWSQQAAMPVRVVTTAAWALNGKAYVYASLDKAMWVYDPDHNVWTRKAVFPGAATLQVEQGFLLNGQIYVAGGLDVNINALAEVWVYDPVGDTWTRKHDLPYGMAFAPAFALNGKGYLCTGNSTREAGSGQSAVFLQYDPTGDVWTSLPDFPGGPRGGGTVFTDGHRAYVGLGNHGPDLTDLWQYDPATQQWTRMTDIPSGRYAVTAFVLGHKAYVVTGASGGALSSDVWQYELPYLYQWSDGETTRSIKVSQPGSYGVTVSSYEGCTAAGAAVPITVEALTAIHAPPAGVTVCAPAAAAFSVNATGTGLSYQWLLNGHPLTDGGVYSGTQTPKLSIANTDGLDNVLLADVVSGVCGVDTSTTALLTVHPVPAVPTIMASGATTFCEGGSVTLTSSAAAVYAWSSGAVSPAIAVSRSGIYSVTVTDSNGCRSATSDADTVTVDPYPSGSITTQGPILSGNHHYMELTAPTAPGFQYQWSNGATTSMTQVSQSGDYSVRVVTAAGCSANFDVNVQLIDLARIPNTFSPNHDGINDTWYVKALDAFPDAVVMVFNRDGSKVFEARNPGIKWDGTYGGRELPAGVYYYIIDLKDGSKPVTGWVNLVR